MTYKQVRDLKKGDVLKNHIHKRFIFQGFVKGSKDSKIVLKDEKKGNLDWVCFDYAIDFLDKI